jgi:hypothetical protein
MHIILYAYAKIGEINQLGNVVTTIGPGSAKISGSAFAHFDNIEDSIQGTNVTIYTTCRDPVTSALKPSASAWGPEAYRGQSVIIMDAHYIVRICQNRGDKSIRQRSDYVGTGLGRNLGFGICVFAQYRAQH